MNSTASKLQRILDLAANCLTVVVCLVLIGSFVRVRLSPVVRTPTVEAGLKRGMEMAKISGLDYDKAPRVLLLFLKSSCEYCLESLPSFRTVAERARASGHVRVVAVFPEGDREAAAFLKDGNVWSDQVLNADFHALKVRATPTIVVVDSQSRIKDFWIGAVSETTEKLILERL